MSAGGVLSHTGATHCREITVRANPEETVIYISIREEEPCGRSCGACIPYRDAIILLGFLTEAVEAIKPKPSKEERIRELLPECLDPLIAETIESILDEEGDL